MQKDQIEDLFKIDNFKNPLSFDEIVNILNIKEEEYNDLAFYLEELEKEYIIIHNKQNKFAPLTFFNLAYGKLEIKNKGYGFVTYQDITYLIKEDDLNKAMDKDMVLIKIINNTTKAKVERIIKRNNDYLYGKVGFYHKKYYFISSTLNSKIMIYLNNVEEFNVNINDYVKIKIIKYLNNKTATAKIIKKYEDDKFNDLKMILLSNNINLSFPDIINDELDNINEEIKPNDLLNRRYIDKKIITIDDITAKDLDDAVSVELNDDGTYKLGVYIADVSHYVKEDTFLDLEAMNRGTSIYLPGMVIPMLPLKLSNNLCSLNPGILRLVTACEIKIDQNGKVLNYELFKAYLKTTYRMTYQDVNKIFDGDLSLINKYQDVIPLLNNAKDLKNILKHNRLSSLALFFNNNDNILELDDDNKIINIKSRIDGEAENIIEEFMILANNIVAIIGHYLDIPFIYRIHNAPNIEKINNIKNQLANYNYQLKINNNIALSLNHALSYFNNNDDIIINHIINDIMVINMEKATYESYNSPHFGLQLQYYTHFTSPIRRYPDLLVHRLLDVFLFNEEISIADKIDFYNHKIIDALLLSNNKERLALKIERDANKYKICEYLENKIGNYYHGIISNITSFGIFVLLDNNIEGMVKVSNLYDDYYEYDEKLNRLIGEHLGIIYNLGDKIEVKILDVSKDERLIDLIIIRKE